MRQAIEDVRYGLRGLRRRPGFTAVVIVTLALGIGANAAIFSVVEGVLLRPLPYPEPDRLVRIWGADPSRDVRFMTTSPIDLADWREQSKSFESLAGWPNIRVGGLTLVQDEGPQELETAYVSEGFFEVLDMPAALGRTLQLADQVEGANRVAVLSDAIWRQRFGADPGIVGGTLVLGGEAFTVVGVMPPPFEFPESRTELWVPVSLIPESGIPRARGINWMSVAGRLKEGVGLEQARTELSGIVERLSREYPDSNEGLTAVTMRPLHEQMVGDVRPALLTLFAAVGAVLLIGCANVANLLLARSEDRGKEIAIRAALGAGRGRIVAQLLTESLVLALLGGAAGLLAGIWGVRALVALAPEEIPRLSAVGLDATVVAFTAGLAIFTGLLFGAAPAARAAGSDLQGHLKEGGRTSAVSARGRLRSLLVVAEVAIVVVVAIGAGLLVRSYAELRDVDPGFDPANVLTLRVSPSGDDYDVFFRQALEQVAALPGVEAAAIGRPLPLRGDTFQGEGIRFGIPGRPEPPPGEEPGGALRFVSPDYFRAMGIPLLAGRDFRWSDDSEAPPVFILSRATVDRFWPDRDPVGQAVTIGETPVTIIGVVGDVQQMSLAEEPEPVIYAAHAQVSRRGMTFVVRTAGEPSSLIGPIQRIIWDLRPEQPINEIAAMSSIVVESVAPQRFSMTLVSLFAGLALLLSAIGIYGVVSYTVSRRTHEMGVRMALGADAANVVGMVVRNGLSVVAVGLLVGLAGGLLATRLIETLLYGVTTRDPLTFVGVVSVLGLVALLASAIPALRAGRVDPVTALRSE